MTFDYNLKEDEYLKAIKLYTRKFTKTGKRKIRITYFAGLVLLVTSAYMFISIFKQYLSFKQSLTDYVVRELLNKLFTQGFGYILIIIIYLLLGIFFLYSAYTYPSARIINKNTDSKTLEPRKVNINDLGIVYWQANNEADKKSYFWDDIEDVFENEEFYLMTVAKNKIFILPKRMISTKIQSEFIEKHVTK
ncbi:YcxB family protein [Enterococcus faecalis]|nr:YcxB family protein [Enterococcus faecalis]